MGLFKELATKYVSNEKQRAKIRRDTEAAEKRREERLNKPKLPENQESNDCPF